jgi:hypothetical protein
MSIDYYSDSVRRRLSALDCMVYCEELIGGEWVVFWQTDSMSNDYAYTDSANRCRLKLMEAREVNHDK